jgi:hypothetical protein
MIKIAKKNSEKVFVTLETKQELISLKKPGEKDGDVIARLIQECKNREYLSHLMEIANTEDFVKLDTDEEYCVIKKR